MRKSFLSKVVARPSLFLLSLGFWQIALSQAPAPSLPDTSKMAYNQISASMSLYAYPSKGQNQQKQKVDEFECYKWAVEQSGIDPLNLPKIEAAPVQSGPTGAAVGGAAVARLSAGAHVFGFEARRATDEIYLPAATP